MPYHIESAGPGKFEVQDDSGKVVGEHATRKQALAQLKALYANVPDAKEISGTPTAVMPHGAGGLMGAPGLDEEEKATDEPGDYLVVEDREKPTTWHLQVRKNGTPDHTLMGAAWAALHEGYRGNKYAGPDSGKALEKLKRLYESEDMPIPGEKEAQPSLIERVISMLTESVSTKHLQGEHSQASHGGGGSASSNSGLTSPKRKPKSNKISLPKQENIDKAFEHLQDVDPDKSISANDLAQRAGVGIHESASALISAELSGLVKQTSQMDGGTYKPLWGEKEGRRNSNNDAGRLQQIHDLSVMNGAECPMVFKQANGTHRWILFSSNAYQDRDKEIISQASLEADVARTDKEAGGNYGPLRWWHMGAPDPIERTPGAGADIGVCDYRAMSGRVLIESGTFVNERIGAAIKERADTLAGSIGFFHPTTEPDSEGVYHNVFVFERSLLPRSKASNPLTALTVTKGNQDMATSKEKTDQLVALLGDQKLAEAVIQQAEQTEKAADDSGLKFKEEAAPVVAETDKAKSAEGKPGDEKTEPKTEAAAEPDWEAMAKALAPHLMKMIDEKMAGAKKEQSEKEAGYTAQLVTLQEQIKELIGEQPRGLRSGFRASLSEATIKDIKFKDAQQGDPLDSVIDQLMGKR